MKPKNSYKQLKQTQHLVKEILNTLRLKYTITYLKNKTFEYINKYKILIKQWIIEKGCAIISHLTQI